MDRSPSPEALAAWRRLLRFHRATLDELDHELQERRGISLDEYDVLVQLAEAPGGALRMGELVAATLIARSSCTRVVDRLVRAEAVRRTVDPHDRRVVLVSLTPAGRRILGRAALVHLDGIARRFADRLTPSDLATLDGILTSLGVGAEPRHPGAKP